MPGISKYGTVSVTAGGTVTLIEQRAGTSRDYATVYVDNTGSNPLTDFQLFVEDAKGNQDEVELTDAEYVAGYTSGITSLASGSAGRVRISLHGVYKWVLKASAGAGAATTINWTWEE
jgi:hypothetical protein